MSLTSKHYFPFPLYSQIPCFGSIPILSPHIFMNQIYNTKIMNYFAPVPVQSQYINFLNKDTSLDYENDEMYLKKEMQSSFKIEDQNFSVQISPKKEAFGENIGASNCKLPNFEMNLRAELNKMISFILINMGKVDQAQIEIFRKTYVNSPCLSQIYDKLVTKYFSAKKGKEDLIRYILRKAFKDLITSIMKKEKVSRQKASMILCKEYFQNSFEQILQSGVDIEDEEELVKHFMPYNKNSKNKTINKSFVGEIFSSEAFCKEYQLFLSKFDGILINENNKKKEKLIDFIIQCIENGSISKIGSFPRFPWLDIWVQETINIANKFQNSKFNNIYKRLKI